MEKQKIILSLFLIGCLGSYKSQDLETRKHLVSATATISPGFQKGNNDVNIYLHGLASFYPEPKVSVDGEIYLFVGGQEQQTKMAENSTLLFGLNFHFAKDGNVDPFIGIMPGLSLVSVNNYTLAHPRASERSIVPVVSFDTGFKFHMAKWCNTFVCVRYLKGTLVEHHYEALQLDELRFSFGLGFNLYSKNMYKKSPEK